MQRTWESHTKKPSRMFPAWLASTTTALVVDSVLVQIQTSDDISSAPQLERTVTVRGKETRQHKRAKARSEPPPPELEHANNHVNYRDFWSVAADFFE
ncbi:hypothetical protein EYF80_041162 [Liparis tanakae]|uniref:Uncharacterized protein n=1 Tax=Liparis tanakae TaxID=230148 RepID=A0A4Z2G747_9TELE|nr:hypothetical protein EYF80_041162 [Liparis tanakae]